MIKSMLFVLFVLLILIGLFLIIYSQLHNKNEKNIVIANQGNKKKVLGFIGGILTTIALIFTIFIPGSFHQVEAGQVAVVKKLGKVAGIRLPGTYFDFYMVNSYTYFDTTVQKLEVNTASYSSDAQTMDIAMTIQFKIDPNKVENIMIEYTSMDSLSARIIKVADDNAKSVLSKYTAMKIIETRSSISPEVENSIKTAVGDKYYCSITAVNLTNIDFTAEFEKAVEDKVVAEQQKEAAITKAEQELEVAKLTAQSKIEEARGDAESQKIIASASAEATGIRIVELARSTGFTVNETYVLTTETVTKNSLTGETISSITNEQEVLVKEDVGTTVTNDLENNTMTTVTKSISSTRYNIVYDETHTKDDLKIVMDYIQYLEYLETWDGKLPEVVAGDNAIGILMPSTSSTTTNNA